MGSISSVEYTDPDLLHGEPPGPHHDVWSLGVMLHRAVTGHGVYGELPGNDGLLALRRILSTKPEVIPDPAATAGRDRAGLPGAGARAAHCAAGGGRAALRRGRRHRLTGNAVTRRC